tara:strand:- start:753 stop:1082 length:330 start_codon:yes stop_codon:yes gene_type:complete
MWNKIKLIEFFQRNLKKQILIEYLGESLLIKGEIESIVELDLCSHSIFEINLIQKKFKNEIFITIHNKFLGINFQILSATLKKNFKKKRIHIPFKKLRITDLNNLAKSH